MKKLAGLMLVLAMLGVLGGCTSTCCQQPTSYTGAG